jgi:hypothetical protein
MSLVDEMWINDERANKFTGVIYQPTIPTSMTIAFLKVFEIERVDNTPNLFKYFVLKCF